MNLSSQGLTESVDVEALVSGLRDSINGELQMSEQEIMSALQTLQASLQAQAEAEMQEQAQAGQNFLAENAAREGVMTTESGLQYEVLSEGDDASAPSPEETDTVQVHYEGALTDGTVFDSSLGGEPASLPLNGVIPGWTEGIQLMQVGDKYRFVIPPELGYGSNAVGPLPANSVLVFEVELLGIE